MTPPKISTNPHTDDLFGGASTATAPKPKPNASKAGTTASPKVASTRPSRAGSESGAGSSGNPGPSPKGSYSLKKRQLSRSKIDLFVECPRCFVLDVKHGIGRVPMPSFTLNNAVDTLFKNEFDIYRKAKQPHPEFAHYGIDAIPYHCPELEQWRKNFTGIRWESKQHGWTFFGAVDDLWVTPANALIVADYKATSKAPDKAPNADNIYPGYRRQLEFYQFLLRRLGFDVEPRAWLVYANGIKTRERFDARLEFDISFIPHDGDDAWVAGALDNAVAAIESTDLPNAAPDCKWCQYRHAEPG